MEIYNVYLDHEYEKYLFMELARRAGAEIWNVSACGAGYVIHIKSDPEKNKYIDKNIYTAAIDELSPAQIWEKWKNSELTVYQMYIYQQRHNIYFDVDGGTIPA